MASAVKPVSRSNWSLEGGAYSRRRQAVQGHGQTWALVCPDLSLTSFVTLVLICKMSVRNK